MALIEPYTMGWHQ